MRLLLLASSALALNCDDPVKTLDPGCLLAALAKRRQLRCQLFNASNGLVCVRRNLYLMGISDIKAAAFSLDTRRL